MLNPAVPLSSRTSAPGLHSLANYTKQVALLAGSQPWDWTVDQQSLRCPQLSITGAESTEVGPKVYQASTGKTRCDQLKSVYLFVMRQNTTICSTLGWTLQ